MTVIYTSEIDRQKTPRLPKWVYVYVIPTSNINVWSSYNEQNSPSNESGWFHAPSSPPSKRPTPTHTPPPFPQPN